MKNTSKSLFPDHKANTNDIKTNRALIISVEKIKALEASHKQAKSEP